MTVGVGRVSDAKKHVHVLKSMAKCLGFSIDEGIYKEIQDQQFELVTKAELKLDPETLTKRHFFTHLTDGASRARCVKCYSSSTGAMRHDYAKAMSGPKGTDLLGLVLT